MKITPTREIWAKYLHMFTKTNRMEVLSQEEVVYISGMLVLDGFTVTSKKENDKYIIKIIERI